MSYQQFITFDSPPPDVLYRCSCSRLKPFYDMFVCQSDTCLTFSCLRCAPAAIDSYYCPQCMSNFSSTVVFNNNRCTICAKCPRCLCAMVRKAKSADPAESNKFDLECEICEYKVSDEGIAQYNKESEEMVESESESKSATKDVNSRNVSMLAKVWSAPDAERKAIAAAARDAEAQHAHSISFADLAAAPAPTAIRIPFERSVGLKKRFESPLHQEDDFQTLRPHHENIFTRHQRRCPKCRKLLIKPVINPKLTSYEMTNTARMSLPRCVISASSNLNIGEWNRALLVFSNPHESALEISISAGKPREAAQKPGSGDETSSEDGALPGPHIVPATADAKEPEDKTDGGADLNVFKDRARMEAMSVLYDGDDNADRPPLSFRSVSAQNPDVLKEANVCAFPVEIRPRKSLSFTLPISITLESLEEDNPLIKFKTFSYTVDLKFTAPAPAPEEQAAAAS